MSFILNTFIQLTEYNYVTAIDACFERNQFPKPCKANIFGYEVNHCTDELIRNCKPKYPHYHDFTDTFNGPSVMFGFLNVPKSDACFEPKCPNMISLYLKGLLDAKTIDYYGLNWLVNRIVYILRLKIAAGKCEKDVKPVCPYEFHYYNNKELIEIIKDILAIGTDIFEQFKCANRPEPKEANSCCNEEENCEEYNLHEVYFKYLCKLIRQVNNMKFNIPLDYEVHALLFTGDAVPAVGNVGINLEDNKFMLPDEENEDANDYFNLRNVRRPIYPEDIRIPNFPEEIPMRPYPEDIRIPNFPEEIPMRPYPEDGKPKKATQTEEPQMPQLPVHEIQPNRNDEAKEKVPDVNQRANAENVNQQQPQHDRLAPQKENIQKDDNLPVAENVMPVAPKEPLNEQPVLQPAVIPDVENNITDANKEDNADPVNPNAPLQDKPIEADRTLNRKRPALENLFDVAGDNH